MSRKYQFLLNCLIIMLVCNSYLVLANELKYDLSGLTKLSVIERIDKGVQEPGCAFFELEQKSINVASFDTENNSLSFIRFSVENTSSFLDYIIANCYISSVINLIKDNEIVGKCTISLNPHNYLPIREACSNFNSKCIDILKANSICIKYKEVEGNFVPNEDPFKLVEPLVKVKENYESKIPTSTFDTVIIPFSQNLSEGISLKYEFPYFDSSDFEVGLNRIRILNFSLNDDTIIILPEDSYPWYSNVKYNRLSEDSHRISLMWKQGSVKQPLLLEYGTPIQRLFYEINKNNKTNLYLTLFIIIFTIYMTLRLFSYNTRQTINVLRLVFSLSFAFFSSLFFFVPTYLPKLFPKIINDQSNLYLHDAFMMSYLTDLSVILGIGIIAIVSFELLLVRYEKKFCHGINIDGSRCRVRLKNREFCHNHRDNIDEQS